MLKAEIKAKGDQVAIESAKRLPDAIKQAMVTGLSRGLQIASGIAQREYLSGPRPARLDVRTGRLRNSLATSVQSSGNRIVGRAGTNVKYAAFHEFGFHGTVNVRAHTRITKVFSTQDWENVEVRRAHFDRDHNFIGFKESNARALARMSKRQRSRVGFHQVSVKQHKRRINYAGRAFMRPALQQALPAMKDAINGELSQVKSA